MFPGCAEINGWNLGIVAAHMSRQQLEQWCQNVKLVLGLIKSRESQGAPKKEG
jgi:hypothetical protein